MAVGSSKLGELLPIKGVRMAAVAAGVRYPDRLDLVLIELDEGSTTVGVFTRNAFCAAPVEIAKSRLLQNPTRYLLINTGNANAGTGQRGKRDAMECCDSLAHLVGVDSGAVLPFSTGVIGEPLPVERIKQGIPAAVAVLADSSWTNAAKGIMTTDTRPKALSVAMELDDNSVTITGIAKGSGMIKPDMATLLAFVFTDALIDKDLLQQMLGEVVNQSFNRITVDGDTSTNDSCMLVATGQSGVSIADLDETSRTLFRENLNLVFGELARGVIRDAEGATKFLTIKVVNGLNSNECLDVAYTVAESPLVKTALFASDPNWGRVLAAVGRAGLQDLDIQRVNIFLGDVCLVSSGGLAEQYTEALGQAEMDKEEVTVTIDLARGEVSETVWTSDLSHDYIRINAEYRT